jgi:MFS family permease
MSAPWFEDVNTFGAYAGAILGGGGGTLAGLWGALAGTLAPKGKAKAFVLGLGIAIAAGGAILAGIGLYAVIVGQPYGIWYPLLLAGTILMIVCGGLVPGVRKRYAEAEARRLTAEQFRGQ